MCAAREPVTLRVVHALSRHRHSLSMRRPRRRPSGAVETRKSCSTSYPKCFVRRPGEASVHARSTLRGPYESGDFRI